MLYISACIPPVHPEIEVIGNDSVVLPAVNWYQELFSILPQNTLFTFPGKSCENVAAVFAEKLPVCFVKVAGVAQ